MDKIILGKSGLVATRPAFGALPVQRVSQSEAVKILRKAKESGITFFDTARFYTDSEKKIGEAFKKQRGEVIIASKSMGRTRAEIETDLKITLAELQTDYLDLYQFHNPESVPLPGDGTGRYELLAELKEKGIIRAIGLTNHILSNIHIGLESELYDTMQFPFSLLATEAEEAMVAECKAKNVGFIAMKGLAGGLLNDIPAVVAYINRFDNVVPIWGVQSLKELDDFLRLAENPPVWEGEIAARGAALKKELGTSFCRSCGYCMPCPLDIDIRNVARLDMLLRRSPWQSYATPEWFEKMRKAESCIQCGICSSRCPYKLETPNLVARNVIDYKQFMQEHGVETGL